VSRPTLVVTGPPGSGKTRLARALAEAIGCPAIGRDEIKEGMVHAQGGAFEAAPGDPLTKRTFPVFFDVLRVLLVAGVTVVADAAFQDKVWRMGLEPLAEQAQLRIVHCSVDAATARDRVAHRLRTEPSRRAHADLHLLETSTHGERPVTSFERLSLPAPSIVVDTTDGYRPDLPEIVAFIGG
jgi:predicted kinase